MLNRRLVPPSPELEARVQSLYGVGDRHLSQQQWDHAFEAFDEAYQLLLAGQPEGRRYHKGQPLHNMGLARLLGNRRSDGHRLTFFAFLEDALSQSEEAPEETLELEMPAARNLIHIFAIPEPTLVGVTRTVRELSRDQLFRDPADLAVRLEFPLPQEERAPEREKRQPGNFGSPWDRRVFVGGSYQRQLVEINLIAEVVRRSGFTAVVEFDFEVPASHIHHHGLMLLHECRWAIFEVTTEAGQLMELERTRDYGISPLAVRQGTSEHGRVSAMVETLLARLGVPAAPYASIDELEQLVRGYLGRAEDALAAE